MFQEDDDDENFVIEDDDEAIGVPDDSATLPLEFSSLGRAKAKDLFKYAVEWMVQKKLNPGFPIRDPVYDLAFRKLDDEFAGKAYDRDTLSDVDSSSDSEDGDDDDDASYDADGNPIPPDSTVFHVGVFCKTNAETAHTLAHWRHHLYSWVVGWLEMQGHLDPDKIVERDGWKTKKRNKYANKIVDEMQASGEIKRLYQDFRSSIDHAREAKQAGWFSR
ncbi:hypothetical protein UCRNP2_8099 [Neofusicoccum parvum UCRNP2]|uniref:DUF4211 domain-containing protein n=1 Tax=Botryosphaeria parva (strain UCR-NP2) TaxID=1287680 RepID=R1GGT4_BOTPV|nr:hypothetical protein UCRNP2_8099 [Neofusicoccum parvum UCRNP2]